MDDVLGHVVVTIGDENLGAENLVRTVTLRLGTRAHQCQVRPRLRLGEVHGAGPFAGHQLFEVGRLERVAARGQQGLDGTIGQQRAQRKAHVGAVDHFDTGRAYRLGQALAAKILRVLQALPAAFGVLAERRLETRGRLYRAVLER